MTGSIVAADAPDAVERAVAALDRGGVVILPTDTVYGLVARPDRADAADRLFELKGRAATVPVAVLCATASQALALAEDRGGLGGRLAEAFWPGPLTIVLPRRRGVVLHLGEPSGTVGLRCPDEPLVRAIAERVGPIAATSANRHGDPTPSSADAAASALGDGVALTIDGGERPGAASTVVDLAVDPWRVRREGPIAAAEIARVLGSARGR